jgi:hypothetical protein
MNFKIITILLITVIVTLISTNIYFIFKYTQTKRQYNQSIIDITACLLDGEIIKQYHETGKKDDMYDIILANLRRIQKIDNITFIYIVKYDENGSNFIFDTDESETHMDLGTTTTWKESFDEMADQVKSLLLAGKELPPIQHNSIFGKMITLHAPLLYQDGSIIKDFYIGIDFVIK